MTAKRRWMIVLAVVVAATVALFHAPLLRGLAGFLIADEPAGAFQHVALLGVDHMPDGDRSCEAAVKLCSKKAVRGIVLVDSRSDRLSEMRILPSFETLVEKIVQPQGVTEESISLARSDGFDDWARARAIETWLADRPDATLLVLCDRFRSAHLRRAIDLSLGPSAAACVGVRGLPDRQFDETNWWKSRVGIKAFGFASLRRIHGWFVGGDHASPQAASADAYEGNVSLGWQR
jgi:hypothetical protein